jgi:hypothetical protein
MADNFVADAGAGGDTFAADDIGGVKYPRGKVVWGADGAANDCALTAALPVQPGTGATFTVGSHDVTNAGTFAVQASQAGTWNITNVSGTVSLPTGASTAAKQPALGTAGTASADVITIQGVASMTAIQVADNGGSLTVDGTVAATQSGTWTVQPGNTANTTAWLVTGTGGTFPVTDSGGSLTVDNATLSVAGGGVEATALRVTIASDSTGVLSVDDNAGSLTVDNGGTFAVQESGAALTALQVMDDWDNAASDGASVSGDVAHDAVDAGEPVKVGAKAETSLKGITLVADGDRTNLHADADGVQVVKLGTTGADAISEAVSNTDGASTAFTNFSAVASTYNYVTSIAVFRTDAGATMAYIDFRDGTAGAVLWRMPLPAGGGAVLSLAGMPIFKTSANTALAFDVSSALTTVYISISGYQSKV